MGLTSTGYQYGAASTHGTIGALAYADGGTYEAFRCTQLNVAGGNDTANTLTINSSVYGVRFNFNSTIVTHSESKKVNDIYTYLAQQYANGTPLVINYVLATPTEETVTLPAISTPKGTAIIDFDTVLEPSKLKIIYKGK